MATSREWDFRFCAPNKRKESEVNFKTTTYMTKISCSFQTRDSANQELRTFLGNTCLGCCSHAGGILPQAQQLLRDRLDVALLAMDPDVCPNHPWGCLKTYNSPKWRWCSIKLSNRKLIHHLCLLPRLARSLGCGYTTVRHTREIAEVYGSDLFSSLVFVLVPKPM